MLESGESDRDLMQDFRTEVFNDRVFVRTPKGKIIDMPKGATPIDFAYYVHMSVGHRCRGAKVNGMIVPLNHRLENGDQVEILTGKEERPSQDEYRGLCAVGFSPSKNSSVVKPAKP